MLRKLYRFLFVKQVIYGVDSQVILGIPVYRCGVPLMTKYRWQFWKHPKKLHMGGIRK